eukprot:CAMPEP_0113646962 /NCGR_PEP_ID=MMETSP0017_2-20120614/24837_1 /TAXON_ID=2856 /ORGANISM="Cylindrotheca closterium" /LENGTH=476 /DNA_ID=CAMNT_0000558947 /DNA_START=152 /DNA_END=1582 /DNA_ORIENTATION=- /assembly_acc=CAM_ASM_000147
MTTSSRPIAQQFYQQVIQKYGWYSKYDTNENDYWFLEIIVGVKSKWIILQSQETDFKIAKTILSSRAMLVLQDEIAQEEAKPLQSLSEVFPTPLVIYDSYHDKTWKRFWEESSSKPSVVGIDVEGNQKSPPVLVQIATNDYTILEVPQDKLSDNLIRLLEDDSITKVFCDNGAHKDKKCLGILSNNNRNNHNSDGHHENDNDDGKKNDHSMLDLTKPPVVDLEVLFGSLAGPVKAARGLSKIMAMCLGLPTSSSSGDGGGCTKVLNVRIGKPKQASQRMKNVGRFALIEQGKRKPLKGLKDLNHKEKQYAALDAWCTLQTYHRLEELQNSNDQLTEPTMIMVLEGDVEGNGGEGLHATISPDAISNEGTISVDKEEQDSKEWLLGENKRLLTLLQDKDKQLNDAQRRIVQLENQVKRLQAVPTTNKGSKPTAGGNQGKKGGGRGGRGGGGRGNKNRKAASNQKQNQNQQQQQQQTI